MGRYLVAAAMAKVIAELLGRKGDWGLGQGMARDWDGHEILGRRLAGLCRAGSLGGWLGLPGLDLPCLDLLCLDLE